MLNAIKEKCWLYNVALITIGDGVVGDVGDVVCIDVVVGWVNEVVYGRMACS